MYKLSDSVSELRGVGPRYLKYLEKLGIKTIKDLLWYFPSRYEDFSQIKKINELQPEEKASIVGVVKKINIRRSFRRKMFIIEALIEDETGTIIAIWFNQLYLSKNIPAGTTISLSGKIKSKGKKLILSSPAKLPPGNFKSVKSFLEKLSRVYSLGYMYRKFSI